MANSRSEPQHWRGDQYKPSSFTSRGRYAKRIVWTLVGVGLVGLFIWLIWDKVRLRPKLAIDTVPSYNFYTLSDRRFAVNDFQALVDSPVFDDDSTVKANSDHAVNVADFFASDDHKSTDEDVAIFYISARGWVSNNEDNDASVRAFILGNGSWHNQADDTSTFLSLENPADRAPLRDILRGIQDLEAKTKLVVLDVNRIDFDAHLGMAVNDLPWVIDEELRGDRKATTEPNGEQDGQQEKGGSYGSDLWVLLPNGPMQPFAVDNAQQQSMFSRALLQGLEGGADGFADGSADEIVTLGELYLYVTHLVTRRTGDLQTPILMRGGDGSDILGSEDAFHDAYDVQLVDISAMDDWRDDKQTARQEAESSDSKPEGGAAAFLQPVPAPDDSNSAQDASKPAEPTGKDANAPPNSTEATAENQTAQGDDNPSTGEEVDNEPGRQPNNSKKEDEVAPPGTTKELLIAAWKLRDEIVARSAEGRGGRRWSPVDFAPQAWRRVEANLSRLAMHVYVDENAISALPEKERKAKRRQGGDKRLQGELKSLWQQLSTLAAVLRDDADSPKTDGPGEVFRVLDAWNQFKTTKTKRGWDTLPDDGSQDAILYSRLRRRSQEFADALFRTGDYVRWYAMYSSVVPDDHLRSNDDQVIAKKVDQLLDALAGERRQLELTLADPQGTTATRQSNIRELQREVSNEIDDENTAISLSLYDVPFFTPVLTHSVVNKLLESASATASGGALQPRDDAKADEILAAAKNAMSAKDVWQAAFSRTQLNARLLEVAMREEFDNWQSPKEAWEDIVENGEVGSNRRAAADAGRAFRQAYRTLAPQLADGVTKAQGPMQVWQAYLAACSLHVRDTRTNWDIPITPPAPVREDELVVQVRDPDETEWTRGYKSGTSDRYGWTKKIVSFEAMGSLPTDKVVGRVEFDGSSLEVKYEVGTSTYELDASGVLELGKLIENEETEITLWVRALKDGGENDKSKMTIRLENAGTQEDQEIHTSDALIYDWKLPYPEEIDLLAVHPRAYWRDEGETKILREKQPKFRAVLRPYPNRSTSFDLSLQNHFNHEKPVTVEAYAAVVNLRRNGPDERDFTDADAADVALLESLDKLIGAPGDRKLLTSLDLTLLPLASTPLQYNPPAPKKPDAPMEGDAAAATPAAAPPPPVDIYNGIVFVITQKDPKFTEKYGADEKKWVRLLEVNPLAPREYLQSSAKYVADGGRIDVTVQPRKGDLIPTNIDPLKKQVPIAVIPQLRNTPDYAPGRKSITSEQDADAVVPIVVNEPSRPAEKQWNLAVDVDGVPRAFLLAPYGDGEVYGSENRQPEARIQFITKDKDGNETGHQRLAIRVDQANAQQQLQVPIVVHVETRENFFPITFDKNRSREQYDRVELRLINLNSGDDRGQLLLPSPFYADRQHVVTLGPKPNASWNFNTTTSDFRITLDDAQLADQAGRFAVVARIIDENSDEEETYQAELVLDNLPPEVNFVNTASSVTLPNALQIEVDADDDEKRVGSGVASVEIFPYDPQGRFTKYEGVKPDVSLQRIGGGSTQWQGTWETLPEIPEGRDSITISIVAKATDEAGIVAITEPHKVTIVKAREVPSNGGKPVKPKFGEIVGKVVYPTGILVKGKTVKLSNLNRQATTNYKGEFRFTKVPMDDSYTLEVDEFRGSTGTPYKGKMEGVKPQSPPEPITFMLEQG